MSGMLNTKSRYGLLPIGLHWLIALAIVGLFWLGLWMTELDYYHGWYERAPSLHKSIGVLVVMTMMFRLGLRIVNPPPPPEAGLQHWEKRSAVSLHWFFYVLVLLMLVSGYMISTADGRSLLVFDWFSIPAVTLNVKNQEDIAGEVHEWLAYLLIVLAILHAAAALKHHFIDNDATLKRMLGVFPPMECS